MKLNGILSLKFCIRKYVSNKVFDLAGFHFIFKGYFPSGFYAVASLPQEPT